MRTIARAFIVRIAFHDCGRDLILMMDHGTITAEQKARTSRCWRCVRDAPPQPPSLFKVWPDALRHGCASSPRRPELRSSLARSSLMVTKVARDWSVNDSQTAGLDRVPVVSHRHRASG